MAGGKREGAGRKPKKGKYRAHINELEKRIIDRLPELIDNMMELAGGVYVEETTPDGTRRVYRQSPDRQSNEYLINRIAGKPTERQESDVNNTGAITVVVKYDTHNSDPPETT